MRKFRSGCHTVYLLVLKLRNCKPCRDHEGPSAYLLLATFDVTASSSELAEKELLGEA